MNPSSNTPTPGLDGGVHAIADSAQALMNATTTAAGDAMRSANRASRESLHAFTDSASHLAHDSAQAVRDRAVQLRDSGTDYIREKPMQAMLIAAGTGAALAVLVRMLVRAGRAR
jgi:ElaB/YqjD/DUF883 family membrane-anchored ribosome-binding protein